MHTSFAKPCVSLALHSPTSIWGTTGTSGALLTIRYPELLGSVSLSLSENGKLMCVHSFARPRIDSAASALIMLYNKSQSIQH